MSEDEGGGLPGVRDEETEEWLQRCSQSTQEVETNRGGKNQRRNPTQNNQTRDVVMVAEADAARTPNDSGKRTLRDFWGQSPTDGGLKRAKRIMGRGKAKNKAYISVQGLRTAFQDVTDRHSIAMYCLSAAYIPLTQLKQKGDAKCIKCNKCHVIGGEGFKPYYVYGQAFFDLHCTDQTCQHVTDAENMAGAMNDLLRRLPANELAYLGMEVEEVSDTDEGTNLKITNPLAWANIDEEEVSEEDATQTEGGNGRSLAVDEPLETQPERQPTQRRLEEDLGAQGPRDEVLIGLQKQLQRLEQKMRALVERKTAREATLAGAQETARIQKAKALEYEDQASAYRLERDELRKELVSTRGQELGRLEAQRMRQRTVRAADVANAQNDFPALHASSGGQAGAGTGAEPSSPVLSDNGSERMELDESVPTYSEMAQRGIRSSSELPKALQSRLERARKSMAPFLRGRPLRQGTDERASTVLYFKGFERSNKKMPRFLRYELQRLAAPGDKDAIHFVDFIGANVCEVLVVTAYKDDLLAAAEYIGLQAMEGSPLAGFASRYQSSSEPNRMLVNGMRCYQRTEWLLQRNIPPAARRFYTELNAAAQTQVEQAHARGAYVPADHLFPTRTRQQRKPSVGRKSQGGKRIREGAVVRAPANQRAPDRRGTPNRATIHNPATSTTAAELTPRLHALLQRLEEAAPPPTNSHNAAPVSERQGIRGENTLVLQ